MGEVQVGGGNHPHVGLFNLRGTYLDIFSILKHAQEHGLRFLRQLAYFVQEEGAAVSLFEIAFSACDRAGERTFFVAEEFGIDGSYRNSSAVDRKKRTRLAAARVVDDARDDILSDSALAGDEHGKVARGDNAGRFERKIERGIIAYDVVAILYSL